jgi:hypothetical protein
MRLTLVRLTLVAFLCLGTLVAASPAASPASPYSKLMGVVPFRSRKSAGNSVAVGSNHSLGPCVASCDANQSCQGFTVDSWALNPPSSCTLHINVSRLVDAACDAPASQLSAFFLKPGTALSAICRIDPQRPWEDSSHDHHKRQFCCVHRYMRF